MLTWMFFLWDKWQRIGTDSKKNTAVAKHYDFQGDIIVLLVSEGPLGSGDSVRVTLSRYTV